VSDGPGAADPDGNGDPFAGRTARAVRVRCDACGPRVVALSAVRLLGRSRRWEYQFTCPGCGTRVRRAADAALRAVLRGAGAAQLSVLGPEPVPETSVQEP
jgi:hypothetical protein